MKESREKNLVFVRRPNETSHSLSISENPMKSRLRCREDSSVAWYNLDKTKPVKGYRCSEFDDNRRKADSSKYFHLMKYLKHRRLEKATVRDHEFEVQEQYKELQSSVCTKRKKDHNEDRMEYLDSEVNNIYHLGAMEASLSDVQVTVKPSYRDENVPFVCLTSRLNGQAVLGYPVEIQELEDDVCQTLRRKKEGGFPRLVWRTAKRTPVCYVASSLGKDSEIVEDSTVGKEKPLTELPKNPEKLKQGKKAESRGCCVPVELIFSTLLAGVGQIQSTA